jgi:hypothetical protein
MWKSLLGELAESGELARLMARGEYRIHASWDQTIGLTCFQCRRSLCRDHLVQPRTGFSDVPQASDYVCPYCHDRMNLC